jgi:cell division protein FtsB
LCPLVVWLGFGERGLIQLHKTEIERQACVDRIRELDEENQVLTEEIGRLRTDMKYIESVARKELNLIGKNEIIYRFDSDKPERKAWDNGEIK